MNVAVLGCVVHVPAGSLNVFEYGNVFGLGSAYATVPNVPPSVSVTVTLPSTMFVGAPQLTGAVPFAVPASSRVAFERVCCAHVIVTVFVWLELAGAAEYEQP